MDTASDLKNRALFETLPVPRAFAALALPTVISQLITLVYNLADAFFVGRTGNPYMVAAVSLVYPIFSMTTALANLFGIGGGSLVSRLLGMQEHDQAKKVCSFSFYGAILASSLFSILCVSFLNPLLTLLGASPDTMEYAQQYMLYIIVLGGVPTVLSATMAHLLRSAGYARHASVGLSLGALLNIGFDPLFMFVLFPSGQEVVGAAFATMLSNCIATVYFIVVLLVMQKKSVLCINPTVGLPQKHNLVAVFSVGLPSALTILLYDLANVFLDALMAVHGDYQVAALGIVLKAERLPLNTGVGLCHGMMPLISYNYTAKNYRRMRSVMNTARICGLVVSVLSIVLYELCSDGVVQLFLNTSSGNVADVTATVALGITFLQFRCLASPFAFLNFHITYTCQALGMGKVALLLATIRQAVLYVPLMFLMDYLLGATGLVLTQVLAEILALCVSLVVFSKINPDRGLEKPAA